MTKKSMPKRRKSLPTQRTVIKRREFYAIPNAKMPNANPNAKKPNANLTPRCQMQILTPRSQMQILTPRGQLSHIIPLPSPVGEGSGVRLSERGWG